MIKQTLFFSSPASLSLKNCQMVIALKDCPETVTRPIEDLGCVVLENQMINITMPLLNALVENNVAVVICNRQQMPTAMLQCLDGNATQAESLKTQVAATEPCKKQAWKQIVEAKIRNQAALLSALGKDADALRPLYTNVKSGDTDNREGIAARLYWQRLMGRDFKREREGAEPNALLNYGYAILRAAVARAIIGSGLMPAFGIFHRNRYNAFPLADDLMEPYRPYVDRIVYNLCEECTLSLTRDAKMALLGVLTTDVKMGNLTRPLQIALTMTTASLAKYYAGETKKLSLPVY